MNKTCHIPSFSMNQIYMHNLNATDGQIFINHSLHTFFDTVNFAKTNEQSTFLHLVILGKWENSFQTQYSSEKNIYSVGLYFVQNLVFEI